MHLRYVFSIMHEKHVSAMCRLYHMTGLNYLPL